jgi:hypothetical protein
MLGPVFARELLRERRRGRRLRLGGWACAALLAAQILFNWLDTMGHASGVVLRPTFLSSGRLHALFVEYFAFLLLITPALAATAFSEDKAKGILADLFTTALTSTEIVLGKLLARSLRALEVVLPCLPVLCAAGAYAGLPLVFFVALLWVTVLVVLGVSAVGLAAAVAARHASGAVFTTYLVVALIALVVEGVPVPPLDPFRALAPCWGRADAGVILRHLLEASLAWAAVALAGFGGAAWRLRPAGLRQTSGAGPKGGRAAPNRPPVSDDPIRWKEYHVDGLALLPALRVLSRSEGINIIGGLSAGAAVNALCFAHLGTRTDPRAFITQAFVFVFAVPLIMAVRCAGAVTGERERQTWDSLCLTPLDGREFLDGKLRGIVDAALPYYWAYAVPTLALSFGAGVEAAVATIISLVVAVPVGYYAATSGLRASAFARTTRRSLLSALFATFVTGMVVCLGTTMGVVFLCTLLMCVLFGPGEVNAWLTIIGSFVGSCVALVALGKSQMRQAAVRVFAIPKEPLPIEPMLDLVIRHAKAKREA